MPFAVVGSNTVVEVGGKKVRGRLYPWGIVEGKQNFQLRNLYALSFFFSLFLSVFSLSICLHSFIQAISVAPLQVHYRLTTQRRSRHSMDTVPEFHAEVPQATASERLAQDPTCTWRPERDSNPWHDPLDERLRIYQ